MKVVKNTLVVAVVAASLGLVGCAKKSDKKVKAPDFGALHTAMEKAGLGTGVLDAMDGDLEKAAGKDGAIIVTASLKLKDVKWPQGFSGNVLQAKANVAKAATVVEAQLTTINDVKKGKESVKPSVKIACSEGWEGCMVHVTVKDGDKVVAQGGMTVDFKTLKTSGKGGTFASAKKAEK